MPYRRIDGTPTDYSYTDPRGSFLGGLVKGIGHVIGGVARTLAPIASLIPGPGTLIGAGLEVVGAGGHSLTPTAGSPAGTPGVSPPPMGLPTSGGPGGGMGLITQSPLGTAVSAAGLQSQVPRGYHLNKSWTYSRKTQSLSSPRSKLVKNRHMNWANSRALVHAERRIGRFVHHATRYIRWVHPHKRGRAFPKFHKKRRAA